MTNRVTKDQLEAIVARINRMTGNPDSPYVNRVAQIGCYHLDYTYGGVALFRMASESGGCHHVLPVGHVPAREMQGLLFAFICGIEAATPST